MNGPHAKPADLSSVRFATYGRWIAAGLLSAGLCSLATLGSGLSAGGDEPGSAKSKLEELKKAREKQAKETARTTPTKPGAKAADAVHPWATPDDVGYIDAMLKEEWDSLKFPVSEAATDGEFVRRVTLDIVGRIPTYDETMVYLADKSAERKEKLVNRLLASPEYGKHFATIWTNLMITDGNAGGNNQDINPNALRAWMEKEFNRGTGWNEMVTQLVGGTGRWDENGAVNFIIANNMQGGNSIQTTSYMTRLFLCVQTQCTECHDHPWNEWKQDQFHGLNAFFSGTRERRVTRVTNDGQQATDYIELSEVPYGSLPEKGVYFERRNGLSVFTQPAYLDGRTVSDLMAGVKAKRVARSAETITSEVLENLKKELANEDENSGDGRPLYLRRELARVMTAEDNPYFARAIVNRMWHHFFGHSFIKNVDDFDNGQDEPTMPDLLDRLAADFRKHGHDLRRLIRWFATTKAYAHSTRIKGKPVADSEGFFTHQLCKPMTAEQLYDSVMTLTQFHKTSKDANTAQERQRFLTEIIRTFGSNSEQTGAPRYEGTITQALMLMNSPLMNQATSCVPGSFLHTLAMDAKLDPVEKAERLYVAGLSRKMTANERRDVTRILAGARTPQQLQEGLSDVLWVILNSSEFVLNH
jgi:hypothetical protein